MNLQEATGKFLTESCIGLRYDAAITAEEQATGVLRGTSIKTNQIPYNMQMDIDRQSLALSLRTFLDSGTARDAFDVYFCYIEMYIGRYGRSRSMVELLSEFENNASSLLMKHRDHYSHSVYVFALGLAIYETNTAFRKAYCEAYGLQDPQEAAHHYLRYWGLTSLFHDIGYPFELPFEQVASYFEVNRKKRTDMPFIAYQNLDNYFGEGPEILAKNIAEKLGDTYPVTYESMLSVIRNKPQHPENFNLFMDHAVFSATLLYRRLFMATEQTPNEAEVDALSAIILHNSMYKFSVAHYKDDGNIPFEVEKMPLAYMLMLCDELQCWDRTLYGRNTRAEVHPVNCEFEFEDAKISAAYVYDISQKNREDSLKKKAPGKPGFDADIASIVNSATVGLSSSIVWKEREQAKKRTYLSDSNFLSLYQFAVALNGRWMLGSEWKEAKENDKEHEFLTSKTEEFETAFEQLSLEYKLSNIRQAKAFDEYLNAIGAFYTDRPVDYPEFTEFTVEETLKIGPMEHERWLREHIAMGWKYGKLKGNEREQMRMHPDMIDESLLIDGELTSDAARLHYRMIGQEEQDKDVEPMNAMVALLALFDGVRFYRFL